MILMTQVPADELNRLRTAPDQLQLHTPQHSAWRTA
jgi:hypothetical protein